MTIIYVTENNCQCYGVTFQNKGCIKVQKFVELSNDKNIIRSQSHENIYWQKSTV